MAHLNWVWRKHVVLSEERRAFWPDVRKLNTMRIDKLERTVVILQPRHRILERPYLVTDHFQGVRPYTPWYLPSDNPQGTEG